MVAVSQPVAGLLASGAARELGEEAGGGLVAGMVARVRKVFGAKRAWASRPVRD